MKIAKQFFRLFGVVLIALIFSTILIVLAYVATAWLKDFVPVNIFTVLFIWFVCVSLGTGRVVYIFRKTPHNFSLYTSAWLLGVSLSCVITWFATINYERPPSVDANIMQVLSATRSQGELYYSRQNGGFSYKGVCESEKILLLIQSVEGYGGVVSCYDWDDSWAIQSTLVKKDGYYCVDSDGRRGMFPSNSISQDDTACGDDVNRYKDRSFDLSTMREVYGQEKDAVLQMVGLETAKMKGYSDINLDSIRYSYSTSTNSYNFGVIGFTISSGVVYLVDKEYEVVSFQDKGRIFVK